MSKLEFGIKVKGYRTNGINRWLENEALIKREREVILSFCFFALSSAPTNNPIVEKKSHSKLVSTDTEGCK